MTSLRSWSRDLGKAPHFPSALATELMDLSSVLPKGEAERELPKVKAENTQTNWGLELSGGNSRCLLSQAPQHLKGSVQMSEQGHHQGWSFLLVSPWLPWRKGPVFGRPAYFGYPLSYDEADVLSWALKIKAAFRDTEPSEGKVITSVKGDTIWSSGKMTSSRCCKNTEKEAGDAPWEVGRGERREEEDGEREVRGRSQERQGRWLPREDNI